MCIGVHCHKEPRQVLADIVYEVFEPVRDNRERDVQVDTCHQHILRSTVEENNCAVIIAQMSHLLRLEGTVRVDGSAQVGKV